MSTATSAPDQGMTLVEHLIELRRRLIVSVVAVGVAMVVVTIFYDQLFDLLLRPYCDVSADDECGLLQTDPLEGFAVRLKVTGYAGVALAMPVLLWQVWRFVSPGLYANEKRYAIPFVATSLVLFTMGASLAYWTMPRALDFLADIGGENLTQFYSPGKYFQLITYMMVAFGIGFEFPILLVFLQLAGLVEPDLLRRGRRYAIVLIVVLVAVITPSGDPYSLLALSAPMAVFYELSIVVGTVVTRRRARADAAS